MRFAKKGLTKNSENTCSGIGIHELATIELPGIKVTLPLLLKLAAPALKLDTTRMQ